MIYGYMRVSKFDQSTNLQSDALQNAGCEYIFKETVSGKNMERPELSKLLENIAESDIVVVYKLDRLGRSLKDLIAIINIFNDKKIEFISISEQINTSTPMGKLVFHIMGAMAEFERDIIVERTLAGLSSAKARGKVGGRPSGITKKYKKIANLVLQAYESNYSLKEIMQTFTIGSASTIYRILKYARSQKANQKAQN